MSSLTGLFIGDNSQRVNELYTLSPGKNIAVALSPLIDGVEADISVMGVGKT